MRWIKNEFWLFKKSLSVANLQRLWWLKFLWFEFWNSISWGLLARLTASQSWVDELYMKIGMAIAASKQASGARELSWNDRPPSREFRGSCKLFLRFDCRLSCGGNAGHCGRYCQRPIPVHHRGLNPRHEMKRHQAEPWARRSESDEMMVYV